MPTDLKCPKCSTPVPETSLFCSTCGAAVTDPGASGPGDRLSDSGAIQLKVLLLEETKGEYEIADELGRGGMAVVYKAHEVHLARDVAIKVLPPELTFGKGAIERFKREAKTAAALDHPNIIPIYRITPGGRLFWYAMKFLEGRSLADILETKGLLTVTETVGILEQVAEALDYAHQRSVIHRDVKPGNVMLDARGRVIVTDFGIAKELHSGALTGSGAILGTPYYMSPEQCRGSATLTGAADQYSLGIMAYQMLSGHLPFEAESAIDLLHKHCMEPPPPLEALLPSLPKHVIEAVNRAVSKKADERFPTVTAFINAMKGAPSGDEATLIMRRRQSMKERLNTLVTGGHAKPSTLKKLGGIAVGVVAVGGLVAGSVWFATKLITGGQDGSPSTVVPTPPRDTLAVASPPVPAAPTTGQLVIDGLPTGGSVAIDDRDTTGTSFLMLPGPHVVRLAATGFEPMVDSLTVAAGDTNRVRFAARRLPAPPTAAATSAAAERRRLDKARLDSVTRANRLAASARSDSVRRANNTRDSLARVVSRASRDSIARVTAAAATARRPARDTTARTAPATRDTPAASPAAGAGMGFVRVTVAGGWASILVDGTPRRQGTSWADSLPAGRHVITVLRDGFTAEPASRSITVRAGQERAVTFAIRPRSTP
ncbi:MAG: protein kinase [Gemmatimonadales bacterium]|nr:protein kinase [Gemmatimonadales bacterium]